MVGITCIAHKGFPVFLESLCIYSKEKKYCELSDINVEECKWGEIILSEITSIPNDEWDINIKIRWFVMKECQVYQDIIRLTKNISPQKIIIGFANNGNYNILTDIGGKVILYNRGLGNSVNISSNDTTPWNPFVTYAQYSENASYITDRICVTFDKLMQQFSYRYLVLFENWDKSNESWQKYNDDEAFPEFKYIEESLFDGTYDKLHDGRLMNYHEAGKPKKLAIKWHIKKSEYTAYFWFEDEEIRDIFDRFYGAHPDTKTDFMIRIDAEHNKYELALYRYGLKEPVVISESAYQLIVFKNKFEYFRSDNYNQPRGAWIW